MKIKLIIGLLFSSALSLLALQATAQSSQGHVHLSATDSAAAVQWYAKHFNGKAIKFNDVETMPVNSVLFGSSMEAVFFERETLAGSEGSVLDHIGFSVDNVAQLVEAIAQDGGEKLGEIINFRGMDVAFVEGPWGTKIELINDPELRGFHHIHFSTPDPTAMMSWFNASFGGELAQFGGVIPGLKVGQIWLLASPAAGDVAPSQGRSFDHFGWNFPSLAEAEAHLETQNIKFDMGPMEYQGFKVAFLTSPHGIYLELIEP